MKRAALVIVAGLTVVGVGTVGTAGVASATKSKAPAVKSISPEHGPVTGGTMVDIHGKNFGGVSAVSFRMRAMVEWVRSRVDPPAP